MTLSGVFIMLYDKDTLKLYLDRGIYGFLMSPYNQDSPRSRHYNALADYACLREGDHVFFFIQRKIIYAGQIIGSNKIGAFYLNGTQSASGRRMHSSLCWDESNRERYEATNIKGIFKVPTNDGVKDRCQPYLIRFKDTLELKGKYISSDDLYWKLGDYPFPLPANSIQGMGFCILTPAETRTALDLLQSNPRGDIKSITNETIALSSEPTPFSVEALGINDLNTAFNQKLLVNEAHIEASIIANPNLLSPQMKPKKNEIICRQVPISPFKPSNMDRADVCYYSDNFSSGLLPTTIIELKRVTAANKDVNQVIRYIDWIYRIAKNETAERVRAFLLAPSFRNNISVNKYQNQITVVPIE